MIEWHRFGDLFKTDRQTSVPRLLTPDAFLPTWYFTADNSNTHTCTMYHADWLWKEEKREKEKEREKPDTSSPYWRNFVKVHARSEWVFGSVFLPGCDPRHGRNRMKWCEVDKSRVSLLQSRRYPPIATKNRCRHGAQEPRDRPITMHHQLHVGYYGAQGGMMPNARRVSYCVLIIERA